MGQDLVGDAPEQQRPHAAPAMRGHKNEVASMGFYETDDAFVGLNLGLMLILHARTEEQVFYPAAILIGEYLKLKLGTGVQSALHA
jgi:hypothetical protein